MVFDIITMGSATVDLFVQTDCELISITNGLSKESLIAYPTGSKILIKERVFHTGGGGTNAAVALARMGLRVGYAGCIGDDEHGQIIRKELKKENVKLILPTKKGSSGFSVILDSIAHDRTILAYKGINDALTQVPLAKMKAPWFYCSSLTGTSWKTFRTLVPKLSGNVVLNPSSYLVKDERKNTLALLRHLHGIIFNLEEARLLLDSKKDPKDLLSMLMIHGLAFAIITDGAKGVHAMADKYYFIRPRKLHVVESTGAGDAFGSTCTGGLAKGLSFAEAMSYGLANAESVIMQQGAKSGLLSLAQLRKKHKTYLVKSR